MNREQKAQRDKTLQDFLALFEKTFGHKPTHRITKKGYYLFDEGQKTEFGCNIFMLGRHLHFLEKEGTSALKRGR